MANEPESTDLQSMRLSVALTNLVTAMRSMDTAQEHMTCTEAGAIADVLRIAGGDAAADRFIEAHAWGDDDGGDEHHQQYHQLRGDTSCDECEYDESDDLTNRQKENPDG